MTDRISPKQESLVYSARQERTENRVLREEGLLAYLKFRNLQPNYLDSASGRHDVAMSLLLAHGQKDASVDQVANTVLALMRAYESGELATFKFDSQVGLISGVDGALEKERNVFHDHEYIDAKTLTGWNADAVDKRIRLENNTYLSSTDTWAFKGAGLPQDGQRVTPSSYAAFKASPYDGRRIFKGYPERKDPLGPENYENGLAGQVLTGTFISGTHRTAGSYLRYGEAAWRNFLRAYTYLEDIPRGTFLSRLGTSVIKQVNALATTPEPGASASVFRAFGNVFRGEPAKPGELRNGKQVSRFETFTEKEVKTLEQQGITVHSLPVPGDKVEGWLEFPPADQVPARLDQIVATLQASLSAENPDVEHAVAVFQKAFVALHPFGDGNGRTSRLLANRVLKEFDLPPIVFENQDRDLVATDEEWHTEVMRGIERSRRMLANAYTSWDTYLQASQLAPGRTPPASVNQRVTIEGLPFDLGADSFLYSPTGRPHLVLDGTLVPIGQLDYYVLARRLKSMPTGVAYTKIAELTAETRALYGHIEAGYGDDGVKVSSELGAVAADLSFSSKPHPRLAALLVDLLNPALAKPDLLFENYSGSSPAARVISQYSQRDLEYKLVLDGLKEQGFNGLADQLMAHRRTLFAMAQNRLDKAMPPLAVAVGPTKPELRYEKIMYDNSPLRHSSLDAAIAADGDDDMVVYRGAYAIEGLVGMAPNNDPRMPSAREIADIRAQRGAVPNMLKALQSITATAQGAEMICITTDLSLLHRAEFASGSKSHEVVMHGMLAPMVASLAADTHIKNWGKIDAPIIDIERRKTDGGLEVTIQKTVFVLKVPKKDLLPAHGTAGGNGSFVTEQEVEGLARLGYGNVVSAFPRERLGSDHDAVAGAKPPLNANKAPSTEFATPSLPDRKL